ncbi:MAG: cell division FtsA domain-containing protein [Minisyncoccia bacterium]
MARKNIAVGIDIGTFQVKIVVAEKGPQTPIILAAVSAESKGLRHGYVVNIPEVARAVRVAKESAEKQIGFSIDSAYVSIGGIGLSGLTSTGTIPIARQDNEITEHDVEEVARAAEENIARNELQNKSIIYNIPIEYSVDKKPVYGKVIGMGGNELTAKVLFVTCLESHLRDLVEALGEAGVETLDISAAPIAASFVTLTKSQRVAGCVLANIGSETVSIAVFENNIPISLEVFPIGSTNITHDIALGMKISLEEAEMLKRGGLVNADYPKKKLDDIISSRLSDIFELVEAHLKKIGRSQLLPAGIIITGGGAGITTIEDYAKASLRLPSRIAHIEIGNREKNIRDSSWAVAYGLCFLGLNREDDVPISIASISGILKRPGKIGKTAKSWFSKFMP